MNDMPPTPKLSAKKRPHTRRWSEQRWLVDNIIEANGIDWDQPRSQYLNVPCGIAASPDFAQIRQQVKKFADCSFAFEQMAKKREAKARAAEEDGNLVTARENYFIAAIHWEALRLWLKGVPVVDHPNNANNCGAVAETGAGRTAEEERP